MALTFSTAILPGFAKEAPDMKHCGILLRLGVLSAYLLLAACSSYVVDTRPIIDGSSPSAPLCYSALGYYYLPKSLLSLTAKTDPSQTPPTSTLALSATLTTIADRDMKPFCLDYLSSSVSKDAVTVNRNENGLLESISANVEDRTPAIAAQLIQTAENLTIAAARDTAVKPQPDNLTVSFDPFSWRDLLLVKAALRRFGYCLYVEGYSFPTGGLTSAQIRAAANAWCSTDANSTAPYEHPLYKFANSPVVPELMQQGVLYRPKTAHKIVILSKKDPRSLDTKWDLYQTKMIEMPNATSVLAIGIQRAMFATQITAINFADGTLTDVAIDKGSEAVGFVQIPLVAAQAIVDIPRQILTFRVADVQSHAALIQAQGNLLNAITSYNAAIAQGQAASGGGLKSASVRSGAFVGACMNAGGDATACADLQRSAR
jgi:hypothetical protein